MINSDWIECNDCSLLNTANIIRLVARKKAPTAVVAECTGGVTVDVEVGFEDVAEAKTRCREIANRGLDTKADKKPARKPATKT